MTVDLEWLVYFGMYFKDFTAMLENDRENDRDESHQIFFMDSAEPSAVVFIFQSSEDISYWNISASAVKKTPTIVLFFSFSI